ncbi:MAG TPA: TetR/AcrR family transcriptional regulator [Solirubrobacteraceae bacterium]|jgi:AcrR family transcriptional regulator|nr:TetR/AcrR family transcriptional regulator [Solirubrobacteraceae bacterium]
MSISRKDRKETQRERLLEGMILAAARRGYAGASVAQVIAHAGVSRPTFYEYFADKEDCFLQTHSEISEQLLEYVSEAVDSEPPERAVQAGVRMLFVRAQARADRARFLVNETLAGGRRALDARDRLIAQIEHVIERARSRASPLAATPDLPTQALLGGICRLLAPRLRRNEDDLAEVADEVCSWIDSYSRPTAEHRWRTLDPGRPLLPARHISELALRPPGALPRGRPNLTSTEIARHQRERIVYATGEMSAEKGYNAATIADITSAAGVDRRAFYAHFRDKQEAFLATHELGFQQTMAVCASAYFSCEEWPERIWDAIHAGTQFNATHPVVAHIGYVEAHAVGSPAIQRVDDSHTAFKMFLHEGYLQASNNPPPATLDALSATIFEIGYLHARKGEIGLLPRLTPNATYLVLAPFLGLQRADEFIDQKLSEAVLPRPAAGPISQTIRAARRRNGQSGARDAPSNPHVAPAEA